MAAMDRNVTISGGAMDDLPRTLRREREARERAQQSGNTTSGYAPSPAGNLAAGSASPSFVPEPALTDHFMMSATTVTDIRIPFFRLMMFGFKLVFAAIPALILLIALLWLAGHALMTFYPWLVKVQLLIKVP